MPAKLGGETSAVKVKADVVAVTDVDLLVLNRAKLDEYRKESPEGYQTILLNTVRFLSHRLVRANREVAALK